MIAKTGIDTAAPVLFRLFDVLPDTNKGGNVSGPGPHKQVPKNLRRINTRHSDSKLTDAASFKIGFPVDGSKIPFPFNGAEESIFIRLVDGRRPFNVFVNDEVVDSGSLSRTMSWVPASPGFYTIVAIDKNGRVSQSKFELASFPIENSILVKILRHHTAGAELLMVFPLPKPLKLLKSF